ncbi:MAG: ATP-binding cassette domain-containing protein [Deltaproteobacteria bacterium]|nr:ATP-binding cassette domain-containing protein [Deltaproteobacteria bacterium]
MKSIEIHLDRVDVDMGTVRILHDIDLHVTGSEHYAVLGDNGAGKTTLLRLLLGELWPSQRSGGARTYRVDGEVSMSPLVVRPHVRLVSPAMADWYQHHDLRVPVWEVICAGLGNTPFLYHSPSEAEESRARAVGRELGLERVLDRPMQTVSTGEAKRTLLARAVVADPKVLAVDELGQGLDRQGQHLIADALERIAATGRTRLFVSGHGLVPIPEAVGGRIFLDQGRRLDRPVQALAAPLALPRRRESVTQVLAAGSPVVEVRSCSVVVGGVPAVDDLSWSVRGGECWGVVGHNGSGKSTLLRMITGYRRPWPGGGLTWFGQADRLGIGRVRARIGILAPWIKDRIDPGATCRDILLSGLCDGLGVHRGLPVTEILKAEDLARDWAMEEWMSRPLRSLSYGQARQVMLARAVVHGPELLVLDEPFSGLDRSWQARMVELLRTFLDQGRTIVLVTHSPEFMDGLLTHGLLLERGQARVIDTWPRVRASADFGRLFGDCGPGGHGPGAP